MTICYLQMTQDSNKTTTMAAAATLVVETTLAEAISEHS